MKAKEYAGLVGSMFGPLQVAGSYRAVANSLAPTLASRFRADHASFKNSVVHLLGCVNNAFHLNPVPQGRTIIRFEKANALFGVVCQDHDNRKAVVWVENRTGKPDDNRACNFRGAAFANQLVQRLRRGEPERLRPAGSLFHPEISVATIEFQTRKYVYCVFHWEGVPVADWFQEVLEPWVQGRELKEELRLGSKSIVEAFEALENVGWRWGVFDPATLTIDECLNVKLVFTGGGFVGEIKRPRCDQGSQKVIKPLLRRGTSHLVSEGNGSVLGMNTRRAKRLLKKMEEEQLLLDEAATDEQGPSVGAETDHVNFSLSDVRRWLERQVGTGMGVLECWEVGPAALVYDRDLAEDLSQVKPAVDAASLMDMLRRSDLQQLMLWLAFGFSTPDENFSVKMQHLRALLDSEEAVTLDGACMAIERFLHGETPRRGAPRTADRKPRCRQPGAMRRLCEMFLLALDPESSESVAREPTYLLFLTTTVFNPEQELALQDDGPGIAMMVRFDPFDDPAFREVALAKLHAGRDEKARSRLRLGEFPREVKLRNEGKFGVGVFAPGKWTKGQFFCWYLGIVAAIPRGRHILTSIGKAAKYCDGSNSRALPLSTYLELGAPGASINSSRDREGVVANLSIDQNIQILHQVGGKRYSLTPLFVANDFEDAPTCWDYDPAAGHGTSNGD
jgi:hypothetical protein